jgi:TM2 domain-containing membrane protein YozV
MARSQSSPGLAALLSFIVPGIGQIYNGHVFWGVFWLIITPGFWLGSGGLLGWICHILAAWQAHGQGRKG